MRSHFSILHGDQADSTIILTALGVDLEGNKEVLAIRTGADEDKDGWTCLLQDLRSRGATQIDLIVTDGHEGLLGAVADLYSATPRRRCLVHKRHTEAPIAHPNTNSLPPSSHLFSSTLHRTVWHV